MNFHLYQKNEKYQKYLCVAATIKQGIHPLLWRHQIWTTCLQRLRHMISSSLVFNLMALQSIYLKVTFPIGREHWQAYYIYIFVYFLAENQGLARFGIYFLSVKGVQLNNGTLKTSIVLCNIQLDDTRESNKSKIRQYLSCKDWQKSVETCVTEQKYMVDVTAIMNPTETFGK